MAKKKVNVLVDPPSASSSDEEEMVTLSGEEEEEIEEDDSSSSAEDEDDLMDPVKIPLEKKKNNPPAAAPESFANSVDSLSVNAATVAKHKEDDQAVKSGKKRTNEKTSNDMHVKRARKVSEHNEKKRKDTKKPLFQRIWSQEDEITILKGMIDFQSNTGNSPYDDMDSFYDSIKKSIVSFEPDKSKLVSKIRSLKRRKYTDKLDKDIGSFSKHDKDCFELGKYIWGSEGMVTESPLKSSVKKKKEKTKQSPLKSSVKKKEKTKLESFKTHGSKAGQVKEVSVDGKDVEGEKEGSVNGENAEEDREVPVPGRESESFGATNWFENSFVVGSVARMGINECAVKQRLATLPREMKKKMEEKWVLLEAKEFEVGAEKASFISEVASLIGKGKR